MKRDYDFTNLRCILDSLTVDQEGALFSFLDALFDLIVDDDEEATI